MKTTFLTVTECCKRNPAHAKLIRAVVKQLGGMDNDTRQMMEDILRHGIDGGFHGFIYYSDTCKFAVKYQKEINALILEQYHVAEYHSLFEMVSNFGTFRNGMDTDIQDVHLFLGGHAKLCKGYTVLNVLTWFAAEEVCRMFLPEF